MTDTPMRPHFLDLPDALPAMIIGARSRVVCAGVDPSQYESITGQLTSLREWPAAFRRAGQEHRDRAKTAEVAGHSCSAGEAYLAAAACAHIATIVPTPDRAGHAEAAADMRNGLAHLDPAARHLVGERFTGLLRRPADVANPALVVIVPGMDSSKEEFHAIAEALLQRGAATLAIDGPGQGELAPTSGPTPDYPAVVAQALAAVRSAGWTPRAVGLIALSLGGYYGATTLAAQPTIRAGVVVSGVSVLDWEHAPPIVVDILTLRAGNAGAARDFAKHVDLSNVAGRIEQPLLVIDGGQDVIPGATNGEFLARGARRAEYLVIPEGDHLVGNARWKWLPHATDWLTGQLTG